MDIAEFDEAFDGIALFALFGPGVDFGDAVEEALYLCCCALGFGDVAGEGEDLAGGLSAEEDGDEGDEAVGVSGGLRKRGRCLQALESEERFADEFCAPPEAEGDYEDHDTLGEGV